MCLCALREVELHFEINSTKTNVHNKNIYENDNLESRLQKLSTDHLYVFHSPCDIDAQTLRQHFYKQKPHTDVTN